MPDTDADLFAAMLANPGAYFAGLSTTDPRSGHISEPDVPGYRRVPFARQENLLIAVLEPERASFGQVRGWFIADTKGRIVRLYADRAYRRLDPGFEAVFRIGRGLPPRDVLPVPLSVLSERRR